MEPLNGNHRVKKQNDILYSQSVITFLFPLLAAPAICCGFSLYGNTGEIGRDRTTPVPGMICLPAAYLFQELYGERHPLFWSPMNPQESSSSRFITVLPC